jgi:ribosomal protein S18 acetylase RimI-like enzyme
MPIPRYLDTSIPRASYGPRRGRRTGRGYPSRVTSPAPGTAYPLDNPVRSSLLGTHAEIAERRGDVLRFPPAMSPFTGLPAEPGPGDWADAAALAGPGGAVLTAAITARPPAGWEVLGRVDGVQLVAADLVPAADPEAVPLGPDDVPEMLDLVARTRPGPFEKRTIDFGGYLGIRRNGRLVAMAGERLRPPGYGEISAVCTDEEWRGHGFASRLIRAVAAGIAARGDTPFLHSASGNPAAIRLYEALGFRLRRATVFTWSRTPAA